ncbi:MbtH family protein (plasmid) [Rhizobium leguminosarum]
MSSESAIQDLYVVVRNHEEQYSIWRSNKPVPSGWEVIGLEAGKEDCLARISELWTDMRPASLRRSMDAAQAADSAD